MNNNQQYQDKTTSNSDRWDAGQKKFRVEKVHGGENVEEIDTLIRINEPDCPHTSMSRDHSETEFIAFICDNPQCGIVKLFNKGENQNESK